MAGEDFKDTPRRAKILYFISYRTLHYPVHIHASEISLRLTPDISTRSKGRGSYLTPTSRRSSATQPTGFPLSGESLPAVLCRRVHMCVPCMRHTHVGLVGCNTHVASSLLWSESTSTAWQHTWASTTFPATAKLQLLRHWC